MNAEQVKLRALEVEKHELQVQLNHAWRRVEKVQEQKRRMERRRLLIGREADAELQREALLDLPSDEWLPALTGVEMPTSRRVSCPLPGHEDSEPSCRFYATTFYCFSCNRGGDIFRFAEELWGVRSFPELRKRLAELLL